MRKFSGIPYFFQWESVSSYIARYSSLFSTIDVVAIGSLNQQLAACRNLDLGIFYQGYHLDQSEHYKNINLLLEKGEIVICRKYRTEITNIKREALKTNCIGIFVLSLVPEV